MARLFTGCALALAAGGLASGACAQEQVANDRMHRDMAVQFTDDADVDFMRSMIPHHEGGVAVAQVPKAWQGPGSARDGRRGDRRTGARDRRDEGVARKARQVTSPI